MGCSAANGLVDTKFTILIKVQFLSVVQFQRRASVRPVLAYYKDNWTYKNSDLNRQKISLRVKAMVACCMFSSLTSV